MSKGGLLILYTLDLELEFSKVHRKLVLQLTDKILRKDYSDWPMLFQKSLLLDIIHTWINQSKYKGDDDEIYLLLNNDDSYNIHNPFVEEGWRVLETLQKLPSMELLRIKFERLFLLQACPVLGAAAA